MDIFQSGYVFESFDYSEIPLVFKFRLRTEAFILLNQTNAEIRCTLTNPEGTQELILTEMAAGMGFTNNKMDVIRFQIPQGSTATFTAIGTAPTSGKLKITFTQ